MSPITVTAQCLCKGCTFKIDLDDKDLSSSTGYCNCTSCRHVTGTLSDSALNITSDFPLQELGLLKKFAFSPRMDLYFCGKCGTTMCFYTPSERELGVKTTVIIEEELDLTRPFDHHIHVKDTKDGGFTGFLTKHEDGQELSTFSTSKEEGSFWTRDNSIHMSNITTKDILPAHCLCNGVKFYITRPDEQSAEGNPEISEMFKNFKNPPKVWWLDASHQKYLAGHCACNSCRLASGCEVVQWAFIPPHNIKLDDLGKENLRFPFGTLQAYQSSKDVTRYFCGTCGAMAFWSSVNRSELIDVAVGLLGAEEGARAESWLQWYSYTYDHTLGYSQDSLHKSSMVRALAKGLKEVNQSTSST